MGLPVPVARRWDARATVPATMLTRRIHHESPRSVTFGLNRFRPNLLRPTPLDPADRPEPAARLYGR